MVRRDGPERGSTTAEFAVGLPAVAAVLLLVIALAMQGAARVSLEEGARAAARELARGEPVSVAEETAHAAAGEAVVVRVSTEGTYTTVQLTRPVSVLGLIDLNSELRAEARARTEHLPGSDGPP